MERIIQLNQSEYEDLCEKASLNDKGIEEKALEYWRKEGIAKITISLNVGEDYKGEYSFDCNSWLYHSGNDTKFEIDPKIEKLIVEYINTHVISSIEDKYGRAIYLINKANKKEKEIYQLFNIARLFVLSGWGSFIGCLMYLIFG